MVKFSGQSAIICTRFIQLWMLLLTWMMSVYGMPFNSFALEWYAAIILFEVISMNIIRGEFTDKGLTYFRVWRVQQVPWEGLQSIRVLSMGNGFILRLKNRSILTRYKFIFSCRPGVSVFYEEARYGDSLVLTQLRKLFVGPTATLPAP